MACDADKDLCFLPGGEKSYQRWEWYGKTYKDRGGVALSINSHKFKNLELEGNHWLVFREIDHLTTERIQLAFKPAGIAIQIRRNTEPGDFTDWELQQMFFVPTKQVSEL
jgi:hypothetical protein